MIRFSRIFLISCLFTQMFLAMDKKIAFTEEDKECYGRLRNLGTHKKGHYWEIGFNLIHNKLTKESVEALAGELGQFPNWTQPPLQGTLVYGKIHIM